MSNSIPLVDVKAQYEHLIPQIQERIGEVLDSGVFILGPNVRAFEAEAADYLGVPRTVGVANGTDALVLALDAMGIGPGDEVICPSFTFYATAESIARRGATPVFADIDPVTLNLDPEDVAARVTERTRALMPVHLFGRVMPLAGLTELGVPDRRGRGAGVRRGGRRQDGRALDVQLLPDQEPLRRSATAGSSRPTTTQLADRITLLRFHGSKEKKEFEAVGYNSRLDELQAAVLRLFLQQMDGWTQARRDAAARYEELGLGELCELPADEPGHVYHMYVVRSAERDRLAEALAAAGIGHASYYVTPLHLQPALRYLGYQEGSFPETERAARENLALPMWAGIPAETQERVVAVIREAAAVRA